MHIGKTNLLSTLDFIEDGRRADIYKWGEHRQSKRKGLRGKVYEFKKLFIDKTILKSFAHNLTVIVLLQMVLAALGTFMCQRLGLHFDVHMSIFVSPIVFPLAFSINADFQRRERVLEDLAQFKGALAILFFCHRDWLQASGLGKEFLKTFNHKLKGLILNIKEYLLTEKVLRRNFILSVIYEDFSDIAQLNDKMRSSELPENSPLITRLIHYHNLMCHAFERLRVIREYRSPRTIRSFTKVFIFLMPIVLSPYYVHMGIKSDNLWSPYYIAVLSSFIFGTLQGVQDILDDPFDGISEDDINLGQLDDWTAQSLITNRTVTVGRFTVTTSVKGKESTDRDGSGSDSEVPSPKRMSVARAPPKRRPILRKTGSHRRVKQSEFQRGHTLYPETASRLEDMQRHGLTGSTTILPGMKMKRANSDSLTMNSSSASLAQLFLQAQERTDGARALELKKQVSFAGHVQGLSDDDQMFVNSGSESSRLSRPSWHLDESEPLIAPDAGSDTGTNSPGIPEVQPDRFSENLPLSPGKILVSGQSSSAIHKNDAPKSLTELFQPVDQTDRGPSPASINATSLPPSLGNLFTPSRPPEKIPASQAECSPPGSRSVLPLSHLARSNDRSFPRVRISRSAPGSPEQRRWDTLSRSSAPISPPESSDRIPLTQVSTSDPNVLDKNDSAKPSSRCSRFTVHVPRKTSLPSQAQVLPEDPQGKENTKVPKKIDPPGSQFRISPPQSADNEKVHDRPLDAPLASPDRSPSLSSTDNQTSQPSRFNVSVPGTIFLQSNTPKPTPPSRRDSSVDEIVRIKNDNCEVYI